MKFVLEKQYGIEERKDFQNDILFVVYRCRTLIKTL